MISSPASVIPPLSTLGDFFDGCYSIITKSGQKRNGTLRYTIRPIREAVELYHQRQLHKLELDVAKSTRRPGVKSCVSEIRQSQEEVR